MFISENLLAQDAEPSLYVYRLADGDKSQTGIVACCSIDEYEQGLIKKHEKTRPDKVEDRDRKSTRLNSSHSRRSRMPSSA